MRERLYYVGGRLHMQNKGADQESVRLLGIALHLFPR